MNSGITRKARKVTDEKRQLGADLVSDLYLNKVIETPPLHARMQTMRLSGGCSRLSLYHLDQDRAKLLGDELVALVVGMHLVAPGGDEE